MFKGLLFFLKCGWKYDKRYILWRIFYQLINPLIPIAATLIPKYIIDELLGDKRPEVLLFYVGIWVGYTALATILSIYFSMDGFTRRCTVSAEFDSGLHQHLSEADFENLESPEFLDRKEKAKKFLYCDWHGFGYLLDCALNILGQIFTLIGIAAIIATLNIWIVILFILLAGAGAIVESKARKKAMALSLQNSADQRGWMYYANIFEDFAYGKEIRLNSIGSWLISRERNYFTRVNRNLKKQNDAYIRSGAVGALFVLIQQSVAYGYLIWRVIGNTISIGSFTMYLSAVTVFSSSLRGIMDSLAEIRAYDMYYNELDKYLLTPKRLREGKQQLPLGEHRIEFKNVSFRYSGTETWALKNVNVVITPGEILSIVGENGAGKTTFVKLLVRLYEPTKGEILLDGVNIQEIDYDRYTELFATVFQDYRLFSFSIKENVSLALPCNDQRVEQILRRVGLDDRLDTLPMGINTPVYKNFDERGIEPSGGEEQKIVLARALYKDAPVIILDEPTSSLDPRAEFEIYQHFNELISGKTAIYISHRLSSSRFCDKILVFDKGRIIERGTHEQLMKIQGKYAELYSMQAQYYE